MRLLVGYDGSAGGRDALQLARLLGDASGASLLVATVLAYGPLPIPDEILEEEEGERARPLLEEAKEKLGGLAVETRAFGGGTPAGVITDLAEREGVDTIVVGFPHRGPIGRRGYGPVLRAPLGSVSTQLVHNAPCPVLVVPRPEDGDREAQDGSR